MRVDFGIISPERRDQELALSHPVIRQWAFAREMLRRLGFAAADLYMSTTPVCGKNGVVDPARTAIGLVLKTQDKQLEWMIGWVDATPDRVATYYDELVDTWNQGGFDLVGGYDVFTSSWAMSNGIEVMLVLRKVGFEIPNVKS